MKMPKVSCICPTYNRGTSHLHLLEEAVESFRLQTWPDKELIILNDTPSQLLHCDVPNVYVFNIMQRYLSLGEKYNAAIALSSGDLICPWEDDDISLPWRISLSVAHLAECDYWNPKKYWYLNGKELISEFSGGIGHNCSIYRRTAFDAVGGYLHISGAQDADMNSKLSRLKVPLHPPLPIRYWYYIYRWRVSPTHLSQCKPHDEYYAKVGKMPITEGHFTLNPHWRDRYDQKCYERIVHEEAKRATTQA